MTTARTEPGSARQGSADDLTRSAGLPRNGHRRRSYGEEGAQLLGAVPDHHAGRLGDLSPRTAEVPEWLGHDQARGVGQLVQQRVVRVLRAKRGDVGAPEQGARADLAGVPERVHRLAVGRGDRALHRERLTMLVSGGFDEPYRTGDG